MSETPKQCPECGAMPWHPSKNSPNTWGWLCGTTEHPGDNRVVSHWCLRRQVAALRSQLADSQRLRAEAERERDEAIPNRVFEQIIELQRKYSEAKYSFFTRQTANNVLAELAALLAPAAEEVEGAR